MRRASAPPVTGARENRIKAMVLEVRTKARHKEEVESLGADLETFDLLEDVLHDLLGEREPDSLTTVMTLRYIRHPYYDPHWPLPAPRVAVLCDPHTETDVVRRALDKLLGTPRYTKAWEILEWERVVRCCERLGRKYEAQKVDIKERGATRTITFLW